MFIGGIVCSPMLHCVLAALSVCPGQVRGSQAGAQGGTCFVMRECGQDTAEQAFNAEFGI